MSSVGSETQVFKLLTFNQLSANTRHFYKIFPVEPKSDLSEALIGIH